MSAGIEFEVEIEAERLISIENSHLMWGRCRCGASALVAPGRVPRCSTCALADAQQARELAPVDGLPELGQGYPPAPAAEREAYPAPEVTSRDEWDGSGCPSPVLKLAERAREALWGVRVQRSRGSAPHATTGRPGAVKWRYAVVLGREDGAWSAYAVYDGDGAVWKSVMLWGSARPWFPFASVTDLAAYIDARGEMDEAWYAGIRQRAASSVARAKQRAKCDRGEHAGVVPSALNPRVIECSICGNDWVSGDEPWRKVKASTKEGMS